MIILKEFLTVATNYFKHNLNSNMIILKAKNNDTPITKNRDLNSNMIILKVVTKILTLV